MEQKNTRMGSSLRMVLLGFLYGYCQPTYLRIHVAILLLDSCCLRDTCVYYELWNQLLCLALLLLQMDLQLCSHVFCDAPDVPTHHHRTSWYSS